MREYVIDLDIDRRKLLRFYQGTATAVVGRARSGERLSLPLACLRPYVTEAGVRGTFRLRVDGNRRLQDIRRLSELSGYR